MSRRKVMVLAAVVLVFVLLEVLIPPPLNWVPTYARQDKNPYGAYVLGELLPGLISEEAPLIMPVTLFETDSLPQRLNLFILADEFLPEQEDVEVLLQKVAAGDHAFIAAHYWGANIADTLGISYQYNYRLFEQQNPQEPDSTNLRFIEQGLAGAQFRIPAGVQPVHFDSLPAGAAVLATAGQGKPVLVSVPFGKGNMVLSSTPLLFTNYFLMQDKSRAFAELALGYLPEQQLLWTEYYQQGRLESTSQLRYVLSQPALRWSYYLGIGILLAFVLFNLKRRQRAIPVVEPPANSSIAFAQTVARLYYSQKDHHDIAMKKITYFKEWLRERYQMPAGTPDQAYLQRLSQKSNRPEAEVKLLFQYFEEIQHQHSLSDEALLTLERRINSWTNPDLAASKP